MSGVFIAGTDTGVGKTLVAQALIERGVAAGRRVAAMKPVSAGCMQTPEGWLNDDVARLRAVSNVALPLALLNPYAFEPPIAPHLAAKQAGIEIDLARIGSAYREIAAHSDEVIVEGVGGLLVPLDAKHSAADIILGLDLPVILVVGMRLGCLNHALLTVEAMAQRGIKLQAWVANQIDPNMSEFDLNLASLKQRISAPLLAIFHHLTTSTKTTSVKWFD